MLDLASIVNGELARLNCPASALANLSGVPSGSLSGYLNGGRAVPRDHAQQIENALNGLKSIVNACHPIPIDFRRTVLLRDLITDFETGALHINIILSEPEPQEQMFHIYVGSQYFVEKNSRNSHLAYGVKTTGSPHEAPLLNKSLAEQIYLELGKLGLKSHVIPSDIGLPRSQNPSKFEDIWQSDPIEAEKQ